MISLPQLVIDLLYLVYVLRGLYYGLKARYITAMMDRSQALVPWAGFSPARIGVDGPCRGYNLRVSQCRSAPLRLTPQISARSPRPLSSIRLHHLLAPCCCFAPSFVIEAEFLQTALRHPFRTALLTRRFAVAEMLKARRPRLRCPQSTLHVRQRCPRMRFARNSTTSSNVPGGGSPSPAA